VKIVQSRYQSDDETIYIKPFGCWHIGHVNYREDIVLDYLQSLNQNNRGLLMGDLLECATKTSIGKGLFDTNMSPHKQKKYLLDLLAPYAEFIDGAVIGNHEERLVKDTSLDLIEDVCNMLDIPYLHYQGFIKYSLQRKAYTINIWHGAGSGATAATAIRKCEEMANKKFADIYCMGHYHRIATSDKIFKLPDVRNMVVTDMHQHFVLTGSALDYDEGYAEMKDLEGKILGYPTIALSNKHRSKKEIQVII